RKMVDDVPDEEKRRRFHLIEALQAEVSLEKMQKFLGQTVEVLVEEQHKGRWRGRNPQGKLVFFEDPRDLKGQLVQVKIDHVGPWSMNGTAVDKPQPQSNSISLPIV
ncbi:MAG: TRAM domain-containing protein, partial [Candidatus Thermofonsia bacterium]